MRIAFDGTTLRPGRTGVGYYTEHLLHYLARQSDDEIVIVSNGPLDTTRPLPARVAVRESRGRVPRMVWMQTLAPRMLRAIGADVAHFTNGMIPIASPVPTIVTIHDMSLTLYPECHPHRRVWLNRPMVDFAARRASAIVTVSESAKRDIVRLYEIPAARVHVVHEAAAPHFTRVSDGRVLAGIRAAYGLAERFILYVGTIEPRKNLPLLIEAFAARHHRGELPHQLVCAGPYGWLSRDINVLIERLNIAHAVRLTGYVNFNDLPALYSAAEMFVFPSMYEGFGLPVAEAMSCGTPVITSGVAALAEVAGGAAEEVEPLNRESLGATLVSLAKSRARREELSALGLQRAQAFSWGRAASETLNVYRQAIADTVRSAAPSPATTLNTGTSR
jgi:glycosyltransferase involved in cell wall biosynthesis